MMLKRLSLAGLMLAAAGCGAKSDGGTPLDGNTGNIKPGDQVDLDGDGTFDGVAIDSDMDGIADGVDTDSDGKIDQPLDGSGGGNGGANGAASGAATAGNGTANNGGAANGGSNDGKCQEYTVRNERVTPDMLIVLDRSGSMQSGSVNRWDPSVTALKDVTGMLDSTINFGLMMFPSDDSCGAADTRVAVGPKTAMSIASELDAESPNGSTPTSVSLEAAHSELNNVAVGPDELPRPKFVLLVTDGSPNCVDVGNNCGFFDFNCLAQAAMMLDQAAVMASVDAINAMAADGIKTYVIGYDTKNDPSLASAMDMMAAAGGTGDTQHRAVEDSASLVQTFEEIAGKAVSCTFSLDEAPPDASFVLVTVDGKQLNLNQPDGWSLSADGKKVEVLGKACETLQGGTGDHTLNVVVQCDVVPII